MVRVQMYGQRGRHTVLYDRVQEAAVFLKLDLDAAGVLPVGRVGLFRLSGQR